MIYNTHDFQAGQVLKASQLNAIEAAIKMMMKKALPADIEFAKSTKGRVSIHVSGLDPEKEYVIQLYRMYTNPDDSRAWQMMWNEKKQESNSGWKFLKGGTRTADEGGLNKKAFTEYTPTWMPNNGVLISRWPVSLGSDETSYILKINPKTWILDNLKPVGEAWESTDQKVTVKGQTSNKAVCALIGTNSKKNQSLKFKAGLLQKESDGTYQLVGMSDTTLVIGGSKLGDACDHCSKVIITNQQASNLFIQIN